MDTNLNPGSPFVTGAAYSNNFAGATVTTLYDIPPDVGFDISASIGVAFASLSPLGVAEFNLYTINLGTGAATLIGRIDGASLEVRDIAVSNASLAAIPAPGSLALLGMGAAALLVTAVRSQRNRSGPIA